MNQITKVLEYAKLVHGQDRFGNEKETMLKRLGNNWVIK